MILVRVVFLLVSSVVGTLLLPLTRKKISLPEWPYTTSPHPIKEKVEREVIKVLVRPGEFLSGQRLSDKRVCDILDSLEKHGGGGEYMTLAQALSLRKQLLVNKLVKDSWRLKSRSADLCKQYYRGRAITEIAILNDFPAVGLLRVVLAERAHECWPDLNVGEVKEVVKLALRPSPAVNENLETETEDEIIEDTDEIERGETEATKYRRERQEVLQQCALQLLTCRDEAQLAEAKEVDQVSYESDSLAQRDFSLAWERALYTHLDQTGVQYLKEQTLSDQGFRSTPDCVILDDIYINGKGPVRWMDSKAYYGSAGSRFFVSKLQKQVLRYNKEFDGQGAIVYRLGYSSELQKQLSHAVTSNGPLLLDKGLLGDTAVSGD